MKILLVILLFATASCKTYKPQPYHWEYLNYKNSNDTINIILDSFHFVITKERSVLYTTSDSTLIWIRFTHTDSKPISTGKDSCCGYPLYGRRTITFNTIDTTK